MSELRDQIVCITGMHRSGTSAFARLLNLGGLYLGTPELIRNPAVDNPTGFWELTPLRRINDTILDRLGGSWSNCPRPAVGWETAPRFDDLRKLAHELLAEHFGGHRPWGWKDPRTSLTLPFWRSLLPRQLFVLCVRSPVSVAKSLYRRNSLPPAMCLELWFEYTLWSLHHTSRDHRVIVCYEDLLEDWRSTYERAVSALELDGMRAPEAFADAAESFLDPELDHRGSSVAGGEHELPASLRCHALYQLLRSAAWDPGNEARVLDDVASVGMTELLGGPPQATDLRSQVSRLSEKLGHALRQRDKSLERERSLHSELRKARDELDRRSEELDLALADRDAARRNARHKAKEVRERENRLRQLKRPGK